ncbi:hypothetical protein [Candidatus Symbiobacter mobilis]|nr:hypothetical protein [Candidatus Symbiobacter mobilis]
MIEALTGQPVRVFQAHAASREDARVSIRQSMQSSSVDMELATYERVAEMESTRFRAEGVIQTADGQAFAFDVELEMHRAYVQESYQSTRIGTQQAAAPLTDPLLLQFDGTGVELQDMQFSFDLNVDGTLDSIAMPATGSGFLALDRNGNGAIDDGSELFGPRSGDGFADLAEHDQDGNGWIDENDPVFSQLRVWTADAQGAQTLSTLEQSGVGALYLGRVQTPFSVQTDDHRTLGQVRSSGVFLTEAGDVKTMHQVDL